MLAGDGVDEEHKSKTVILFFGDVTLVRVVQTPL